MEQIHLVQRKTELLPNHGAGEILPLPYDLRQKARQRVTLESGKELGLILPRGTTLKHGDLLTAEDGTAIRVVAAEEKVSIARIENPLQLARIAYHLGNRHVAVQVLEDRLVYLHDHVLDDMVQGLGAAVSVCRQPFEPEEGAYHGGGHHHH